MLDMLIRSYFLLVCYIVCVGLSHGYVEKSVVPGSLEEVLFSHVRAKRATDKTGFTQAEKDNIVAKHNEFRRVPNAANMQYMTWDNELETLAQNYANLCKYVHNPNRQVTSGATAGENLYARTPNYNGETVPVISWNAEVSDYTYSSNTCSAVCGHYTQVVWATSDKVGCGIKYCPTAENLSWTDVYLVVCNYLVAGNLVGAKPYIEGSSCSQCPAGKTTCDNGLCRDTSAVTESSTQSSTTESQTTTVATVNTTSGTAAVTTTATGNFAMIVSLVWLTLRSR